MGRILMDEPLRPGEGILHHPEGVDLMLSLIHIFKKHDFKVFGWYRIVLGILVVLIKS